MDCLTCKNLLNLLADTLANEGTRNTETESKYTEIILNLKKDKIKPGGIHHNIVGTKQRLLGNQSEVYCSEKNKQLHQESKQDTLERF